jgi:anti-anti-sigma factor
MRINQRQLRDSTVLELHGPLTVPAAPELLDATVRKLIRLGSKRLVLDLEDVPSIDAAGLGALVAAYSASTRSGGGLRLAHVERRVHTLLAVCRLTAILETFDSVEDAVQEGVGPGLPRSPASRRATHWSQTSLDVIQHFLERA